MVSLTTQDLLGLLKGIQGENEVEDIAQYQYAIYVCKSSESGERQIRPLGGKVYRVQKTS